MLCLDIETMEGSEKDRFLGLFYDHYIIWCVPPKKRVCRFRFMVMYACLHLDVSVPLCVNYLDFSTTTSSGALRAYT